MSWQSTILGMSGLVAYWPLNETSGTTATDLGPNGLNAAYVGTAGTNYTLNQPGPTFVGNAVTLDGTAGCVNGPILNTTPGGFLWPGGNGAGVPTGAVSVVCWVNFTSTAAGYFVDCAKQYNIRQQAASDVRWEVTNNFTLFGDVDDFTSLATGAWIMMTLTWDGTTVKGYHNTTSAGTAAFSAALGGTPPGDPFSIGYHAASLNNFFNGSICAVGVFGRGLSSTEVGTLFTAGTTPGASTGPSVFSVSDPQGFRIPGIH
jgi:hypothetical protein